MRKSPASSDRRTAGRRKTPHAKTVTDQAPDGSTTARATTYEPFLGIDFGTSYSAMAWVHPESGQANILCNAEGEEKTRSAVYFGSNGQIEVGKYAEQYLEDETESDRVLLSFKRDLAKNIVSGIVDGKTIRPLDVAVQVFAKLKHDAEKANFHKPVRRAVVTVPASFDPLERESVGEAARRAGFEEVELLDEPVAAAIAYLKAGLEVGRRVLVFDLGAGTFDAAILDRDDDEGRPFHLAIEPRGKQVGGDDFDRALMNHVLEGTPEAAADHTFIPRLLCRCRCLKETLSRRDRHVLSMPLPNGSTLRKEVSRATFESLIATPVASIVRLSAELAEKAAKNGGPPDTLVLIGGSSRIPFVGRMLAQALPLPPRAWHCQDLAVALGAAYYGEILWGVKAVKMYRNILQKAARTTATLRVLRDILQERTTLALPIPQAECIETEELGQTLEYRLAQELACATTEYEDLLRNACRNREPERGDLESLQKAAERLGLTGTEVADIERGVFGASKEDVFRQQQSKREERANELFDKAWHNYQQGQFDEALSLAQAACDVDFEFIRGHRLRMWVLWHQKRWDAAESAASVCLRLAPESSDDRITRAWIRLELGHYKESLRDFDATLNKTTPDEDHHWFAYRAVARYRLNDSRGAVEDLKQALVDPVDSGGCERKGVPRVAIQVALGAILLTSIEDAEQATEWFKRALYEIPQPSSPHHESFRAFLSSFGTLPLIAFVDDPSHLVQQGLWIAYRQHLPIVGDAVEMFAKDMAQSGQEIHKKLWQAEKIICIEMLKMFARRGDIKQYVVWRRQLVGSVVGQLSGFNILQKLMKEVPSVADCEKQIGIQIVPVRTTPRPIGTEGPKEGPRELSGCEIVLVVLAVCLGAILFVSIFAP